MKTNELRIGNYVMDRGIIQKVVSIRTKEYGQWTEDKMSNIITMCNGAYYDCTEEEISPIPLTEEMLLKCGFEYKDNAYIKYIYKKTEGIKIMGYDMNYYFSLNMFKTIKIKSVHQLQNMYFTLTGEELEVKL